MTFLEDARYVLRIGPNQTVQVDVVLDKPADILEAHKLNNLYNIERALAEMASKLYEVKDID